MEFIEIFYDLKNNIVPYCLFCYYLLNLIKFIWNNYYKINQRVKKTMFIIYFLIYLTLIMISFKRIFKKVQIILKLDSFYCFSYQELNFLIMHELAFLERF